MIDIVELTKRLGLESHEQSAVAAWTGDPYGTQWNEAEADELVEAWKSEQAKRQDPDAYLNKQADEAW